MPESFQGGATVPEVLKGRKPTPGPKLRPPSSPLPSQTQNFVWQSHLSWSFPCLGIPGLVAALAVTG